MSEIFTPDRVLIIAEIGNNHEGQFDVAETLVRKAAECGVDAVKFQTFKTDHYVSRSDTARHNRLKSFELTHEQFAALSKLSRSLGLLFISTPFDLQSAAFLEKIVDAFKIASGDVNFFPLIDRVTSTGKPLILSTGGCNMDEINAAVEFVKQRHRGELAVLHCVSSYPAPPEQLNLRSIDFLFRNLDCPIGFSDHTIGIDAAVLAVALGAGIIEKHFTLDKNFSEFRDHQLSCDPDEMKALVNRIRHASSMLGSFSKAPMPCEKDGISSMRRSIVAADDLPADHCVELADITWIRPEGGLPPGEEAQIVGKRLKRSISFGERLLASDVES